jgi:hypothetical protein
VNINEAKKYIEAQARQNQVGNIPIDKLNVFFKRAQLEIVDELRDAFEATSIISDHLAPLVVSVEISGLASGIANKPANFYSFIPPLEVDYTSGAFQTWYPADLITHGEKGVRLNSQIDYPGVDNPIAINYAGYFQVYPTTTEKVRLTYIKKPADPAWNYTIVNSAPTYNAAGSIDFELPEATHTRICNKVLGYYGISLRDGELLSIEKQKE